MAIPNARISLTCTDSEGHASVMTIYSPAALTAIVPILTPFKAIVEALTDASVTKIEVTRQDPEPVTTIPAGNVDNEIKAQFGFLTEDSTVALISVPAFDRSKLIPNSNIVDVTDAAVAAFTAAMTTGNLDVVDSRGSDLKTLKSAFEAYGRRRR